jgi:hypothetical protein
MHDGLDCIAKKSGAGDYPMALRDRSVSRIAWKGIMILRLEL